MLLSHVQLGIADFPRAFGFYTGLMAELGFVLKVDRPEQGWAGWQAPGAARPLFLIGRPFDRGDAHPGNGQMVALLARDRPTVDRVHRWVIEHGAADEGAPGLRPWYHAHYYGAYFRDLDRNKLCVCCHAAPPEGDVAP